MSDQAEALPLNFELELNLHSMREKDPDFNWSLSHAIITQWQLLMPLR